MVGNSNISREIIDKLNMVQEFVDDLYFGRQHYKSRIAFIANTLNETVETLKSIPKCKQKV